MPYVVTGNISVYGASEPLLTVEPGVEVRFNGLYYLNVGYSSLKGRLVAQGTSSNPISFTSNKSTQAPGDWYGIRFYNHATAESVLDHVTVEYAGKTYGGIYTSNSSPTISNASIRNNSNKGIDIAYGSSSVITNCDISSNATYGIYADGSSTPSLSNTSFTNNGSYPVNIGSGSPGAGITASGNGTDGIELRGATVTQDTTWSYQSIPYIITGDVSVYGPSEPVLILEPGVMAKFSGIYKLKIGDTSSQGRLIAQGTPSGRIVLTSVSASPGSWIGIQFYNHASSESILDYVTVEYGGYLVSGIYTFNSSPVITNSVIQNNANMGMYVTGTSDPVIANSTISGNASHGIYATGGISPAISNTLFINNGSYPLSIEPGAASDLGTGITANGNLQDGIELRGAARARKRMLQ